MKIKTFFTLLLVIAAGIKIQAQVTKALNQLVPIDLVDQRSSVNKTVGGIGSSVNISIVAGIKYLDACSNEESFGDLKIEVTWHNANDETGKYMLQMMKDMNVAVDRISSAVKKNERILVYGDYDVDGTTAVALVYSFLKEQYSNVEYYIPDRYKEGYGVSFEGLDFAYQSNCKVVITLDCGIKAVEKVKYARTKGLDVIICDHHYPGDEIPKAVAVLDPKQPSCNYPYKELSGCGVGFKLIQAYSRVHGIPFSSIYNYLDLVAVSIASDIVPLTGENRVLAYYGLKQLNESPRTGLKEIIRESDVTRALTIEDVVFKIGPRINAAGRMETGSKAVDLLVSSDTRLATGISKEINNFNIERRSVDRIITTEAMRMISEDQRTVNSRTTVLYNPTWKKGVIGIVASRLIETYYRPTVILTESNGFATGSARSWLNARASC